MLGAFQRARNSRAAPDHVRSPESRMGFVRSPEKEADTEDVLFA